MRILPMKRWVGHMGVLKEHDDALWVNHLLHEGTDLVIAGLVVLYLITMVAFVFL